MLGRSSCWIWATFDTSDCASILNSGHSCHILSPRHLWFGISYRDHGHGLNLDSDIVPVICKRMHLDWILGRDSSLWGKVGRPWYRVPRAVAAPGSLEVFQARLDGTWSNLI